jgi:hypothetical protein
VGIAELAEQIPRLLEEVPAPPSTPNRAGSWPTAMNSPSPNRNPVSTGFEIRSVIPPRRSRPEPANTTAATRASAADSAAKRAVSPSASGPTAAADRAAVAVVALTTSVRELPRRA